MYLSSSNCFGLLYKKKTGLYPLAFFIGKSVTVLSAPLGLLILQFNVLQSYKINHGLIEIYTVAS